MKIVHEKSTDNFVIVDDMNEVFDSRNGKKRAPIRTIIDESWSEQDRAEYGIYLVDPATIPEGHSVVSTNIERVDGVVVETLTTAEDPIPEPSEPLDFTNFHPRELLQHLCAAMEAEIPSMTPGMGHKIAMDAIERMKR